jgi:amino acid transporter
MPPPYVPPYGAPQQPPPYTGPQQQYGGPPPYAAQQPPYGGYPQPVGYGTPPYGGYPQPVPTSGWTIGLVVVSALCLFFAFVGVPSLVIGIIALTKSRAEPAEAKRLTWIGWLVLGILLAVLVVFVVVLVGLAVSTSSSDSGPTIGALGTTVRLQALRGT